MIDLKQELLGFPPFDLDELKKSGQVLPDNVRNSISLYNKALDSIRLKSEDMAIIELKKAVAMNPDFCIAMNLLGLCYVNIKEYSKAEEMFKRVMDIENNSAKASGYLKMLEAPEGSKPAPGKGRRKSAQGEDAKADTVINIKNANSKEAASKKPETSWFAVINRGGRPDWMKYAVGFVLGAVMVFALSSVFLRDGGNDTPNGDISLENTSAGKSSEYESRINQLTEENKNLQKDLTALNTEMQYYKNAMKLTDVEKQALAKDYEGAADSLMLLKTIAFKPPEKDKLEKLLKDITPKAARSAFDKGMAYFKQGKYTEAAQKLSKVQTYGTGWDFMDMGLYNLGKCYVALNDSRSAVLAFQEVLKQYPGSRYAAWSNNRIKELTQVP